MSKKLDFRALALTLFIAGLLTLEVTQLKASMLNFEYELAQM